MENPEIELKIKVMYEDDIIIKCHEDITVLELKELISEKTGIPVDSQKLIFLGRVLDNSKKLAEHNIHDHCVLSLVKSSVHCIYCVINSPNNSLLPRSPSPQHRKCLT